MRSKIFCVALIVVALPLLVSGGSRLAAGLQQQRPQSAVLAMGAVTAAALLLLIAGGFGLKTGRNPDLRLLLAALLVMSLEVFFN